MGLGELRHFSRSARWQYIRLRTGNLRLDELQFYCPPWEAILQQTILDLRAPSLIRCAELRSSDQTNSYGAIEGFMTILVDVDASLDYLSQKINNVSCGRDSTSKDA